MNNSENQNQPVLLNNEPNITSFQAFFWACSGVNVYILTGKHSDFPTPLTTEYNKFVGIGTAVFFTACFAVLSSSFAIYYLVQSFNLNGFITLIICAFFGIFWGLNIFFLDRYIVSTMRKSNNKWQEILQALPRFFIAMIFAITITVPIEIALFSGTINAEMSKKNEETISECEKEFKEKIDGLNGSVNILDKEIDAKKQNKPVGYENLDNERQNLNRQIPSLQEKITQNQGIINRNYESNPDYPNNSQDRTRPNSTARRLINENFYYRNLINKAYNDIKNLDEQIKQKYVDFEKEIIVFEKQKEEQKRPFLTQIDSLKQSYAGTIQKCKTDARGRTDILARYEALEELKGNTFSSIWWASTMLRLLFLMLEMSPILSKIIAKRGTYDDRIDCIEGKERLQNSEINSKINERLMQIRSSFDLESEKIKLDNEYELRKEKLRKDLSLQEETASIQDRKNELDNIIEGEKNANKQIIDEIVKRQFELAQIQIDEWYKSEKEKIVQKPNNYLK